MIEVDNTFYSIDDLELTDIQKMQVLSWFARKIWVIAEESCWDGEYYHKSYDPLSFWDGQAHSYVFDLEDGGRHHNYKSLKHLEDMLVNETIEDIKNRIRQERK